MSTLRLTEKPIVLDEIKIVRDEDLTDSDLKRLAFYDYLATTGVFLLMAAGVSVFLVPFVGIAIGLVAIPLTVLNSKKHAALTLSIAQKSIDNDKAYLAACNAKKEEAEQKITTWIRNELNINITKIAAAELFKGNSVTLKTGEDACIKTTASGEKYLFRIEPYITTEKINN
jgi:hypothetical protein